MKKQLIILILLIVFLLCSFYPSDMSEIIFDTDLGSF